VFCLTFLAFSDDLDYPRDVPRLVNLWRESCSLFLFYNGNRGFAYFFTGKWELKDTWNWRLGLVKIAKLEFRNRSFEKKLRLGRNIDNPPPFRILFEPLHVHKWSKEKMQQSSDQVVNLNYINLPERLRFSSLRYEGTSCSAYPKVAFQR